MLKCSILIILLAGIAFLSFYRYRKVSRTLKAMQQRNKSFEETLNHLVHNAKNPLATTAMALHNLSFVLNEQELNTKKQPDSITEFLTSALTAIDETNERLKETILFCRTDMHHFKPVNIVDIAEAFVSDIDPAVILMTGFDNGLPMLKSDIQIVRLVFSYLLSLTYGKPQKQIVHFKLRRSHPKQKMVTCEIYNHNYLGLETECANTDPLKADDLDDSSKMKLTVVQRILLFHQSELKGCYEKQNGGYWTFTLTGIKD